jgi:hypothetical protein
LSLPWTTSNTVALELASMRLRNFSIEKGGLATLICAPYALHSATIADFAPGHSVVERSSLTSTWPRRFIVLTTRLSAGCSGVSNAGAPAL